MPPIHFAVALAFAASPGRAAWYDFAKNDAAPEVARLEVAGRDMEDLVELLTLYPDELKGGKLTVRGKAQTSRGNIGAVMVSVDGGTSFEKAKLDRSGAFLFDFAPVQDREYELQLKALDTTGRSSDAKAGAFKFVVRLDRTREETLKTFEALLEHYRAKDRAAFMARVSVRFQGDRVALEDALQKDFSSLEDIRLKPSIARVSRTEGVSEVFFQFQRTVRSRTSGKTLSDSSSSAMAFTRDGEEMTLYSMSQPLIFGLSGGAEVATSVEPSAQGQQVIAVTAQGDTIKVEQQVTVNETSGQTASNIVSGTLVVNCSMNLVTEVGVPKCPAISLTSQAGTRLLTNQQLNHASNMTEGEVSVYIQDPATAPGAPLTAVPCTFVVEPTSLIRDMNAASLAAVQAVPSDAAEYVPSNTTGSRVEMTVGRVYAVKTPSLYALLRPTQATCTYGPAPNNAIVAINVSFDYRIQLSQNPSFN